ncbi:MAG: phosphoribosylformylglycinamidine synthase I [Desulfatiglandaceae bacterium]|jgi:phosphoribosylformylglycinamidine synthase
MTSVKALVLTGYGLNCDYETDYALRLAGAESSRVHINEVISGYGSNLEDFQILVFGGGFSWGDDHGAGVLMASKLKRHLGDDIARFIDDGKLILGICNGFQCLVNLGLLPAFDDRYDERRTALACNDSGNFINTWVKLKINTDSPCIFTRGLSTIDLPVRHGEGKFFASEEDLMRLFKDNQVVLQYADPEGDEARGAWPWNPNGSLRDIAGICDSTGRVFGLMPHPEAFNHSTNHPEWTRRKQELLRRGEAFHSEEGQGILIFRNAVEYLASTL